MSASDMTAMRKGKPESFGWLRRKDSDRKGREAWEMPDGKIIFLVAGTQQVQMPDTRVKARAHSHQPEVYRLKHPPKHFKIAAADRKTMAKGQLLIRYHDDYGLADDDTDTFNEKFISVSTVAGEPPFFTMPLSGLELLDLTPPDDAHVHAVCKIRQGAACCRYLVVGAGGWCCAKLVADLRAQIDARTNMIAKADNCEGRGVDKPKGLTT